MSLELGMLYGAEIVSHGLIIIGESTAVEIKFRTDEGDEGSAKIFITEKSANMAKAQLKMCGFDVMSDSLERLDEDPVMLAGTRINIETEEYKGKLQCRIPTTMKPTKKAARALTAMLRGDAPAPEEEIPF